MWQMDEDWIMTSWTAANRNILSRLLHCLRKTLHSSISNRYTTSKKVIATHRTVLIYLENKSIELYVQTRRVGLYFCKWYTYYSAESFSWYSRARLKHSCTPPSFQSRFIIDANSPDKPVSSALLANANSWRASSYWQKYESQFRVFCWLIIEIEKLLRKFVVAAFRAYHF